MAIDISCENTINDIITECQDQVLNAGIYANIVAISVDDIDYDSSVLGTLEDSHTVSTIALKTGTSGYRLVLNGGDMTNFNVQDNYDGGDGSTIGVTTQIATAVVQGICSSELKSIQGYKSGRYVIVAKIQDQGAGDCKYQVYGWNVGLKLQTVAQNSGDNSGLATLTFQTPSNLSERQTHLVYFDTDSLTSDTNFENAFASA